MGLIWSAKPTISDKIYIYGIYVIFLFIYPGAIGMQRREELSTYSLAVGGVLYLTLIVAISVITFQNIKNKRTIAQSKNFKQKAGISSIGPIPIIQNIKGNFAWVLLPLNIAIWATFGFISLVFGPPYILECLLTSMKCRFS